MKKYTVYVKGSNRILKDDVEAKDLFAVLPAASRPIGGNGSEKEDKHGVCVPVIPKITYKCPNGDTVIITEKQLSDA